MLIVSHRSGLAASPQVSYIFQVAGSSGGPITDPDAAELLAAFLTALHQNAPVDAPTTSARGISLKAADLDQWRSRPQSLLGGKPTWHPAGQAALTRVLTFT
jgi:hypothetical protein